MYLFQSKNEDPEVVIFPMYQSFPHPRKPGVMIPIQYVPDVSALAKEIKHNGADVPEPTFETEKKADKAEEDYNAAKKKIEELQDEISRLTVNAKTSVEQKPESAIAGVGPQPTPERAAKAKKPDNFIEPGAGSTDYGTARRGSDDLRKAIKDLQPEKDIDEAEEKEDNTIVERAKKDKK
jgi:hypothetical protein